MMNIIVHHKFFVLQLLIKLKKKIKYILLLIHWTRRTV